MTSVKHQPAFPQTPELQVPGWNCGPALPQIISQLPHFNLVRVAETKRQAVPSSAPFRSTGTGNWKIRMASGLTPKTSVSDIPDAISEPCVASAAAEQNADRLVTPCYDLAASCSLSLVLCGETIEPAVHNAHRTVATFERIVRGNAPNIGGSHEKRNVDQCSPARREPDWRC